MSSGCISGILTLSKVIVVFIFHHQIPLQGVMDIDVSGGSVQHGYTHMVPKASISPPPVPTSLAPTFGLLRLRTRQQVLLGCICSHVRQFTLLAHAWGDEGAPSIDKFSTP